MRGQLPFPGQGNGSCPLIGFCKKKQNVPTPLTAFVGQGTIDGMRHLAILLMLAIVTGICGGSARAASIAIVDAEGKPVPGATIVCIDPASGDSSPVAEGRATLTDACRRARCEAQGFLPSEVGLAGAEPRCVLRPATLIRCELPAAAASGLEVRLKKFGKDSASVATIPVPVAAPGATSTRFALPPVAPGRYTLELARAKDGWTCRADLGPIGAGGHPVALGWREPTSLRVRVKGADGKPAAGAVVRAWSRRPATTEPGLASSTIGTWTCAPPSAAPRATDATGAVRLPVDLSDETLVVAGDLKDARGLAFQIVERAPSEALTVTLAAPVRLRARVEDDKDRPVACDASLTDLPADVSWLAAVVPGAAVRGACDPQGRLALGPIPSTPLTLEVRPRVGFPMRVSADAPAPGTTADLGVLRVRSGESIRVVVQDDLGGPVRGANVTARGAAGILLTVTGTTGEDGGVNLSGIPKNASLGIDVKAKGFLPAHETQLDLESSPFVVKLASGAAISGTVRDADGQPVDGAEIALTGEKGDGRRVERADARGDFVFDGVDDGTWRLSAKAAGFAPSDPEKVEISDHGSAVGVILKLAPAEGISGRVTDGAGSPVAGARVRLLSSQPDDDLDRLPPLAEATSGSDGAYQVRADAMHDTWLVATKPGFGPCAVQSPAAAASEGEVVLALTEPSSVLVHLPRGARTSRMLRVLDGAGIGRTVPVAGAIEISLTDLAPGRGRVGLVDGPERAFALNALETTEVSLDAAAAIEGRVTFEGAPSARVYVRAALEGGGGRSGVLGGAFTDERGRYRIDGLAAESYRVVAVGEDGRAESTLILANGETGHADLALRSVRLITSVVDAGSHNPIGGIGVWASPGNAVCSSMMGTTSWGDPGELGYEIAIGSNGCLASKTNAAGVARLVLAVPGSYQIQIDDESYEPWEESVALVDGTTTRRVALTRKGDHPGDKAHVIANLRTDPPGLSGTIECVAGGNTNSSSPVSGRYDCGAMTPGPGEIRFRVDGYGVGRTAFEVPRSGELVVDVDVPRGGRIVVPITQESAVQPVLVDASGVAWSESNGRGRLSATLEDLPQIGRAWVFRDVPPSTYTVTVDGRARSPVPLASGGTAIAY